MHFRLADNGQAFSTRLRGEQLLEDFEAQTAGAATVAIDFAGIRSLSYSFGDSFVGEAIERAQSGRYAFNLCLQHVPPQSQRVIRESISNRGLDVSAEKLFEATS